MISIRKRWKVYQYCFESGKVNRKRKQITKSGFKTKNEAFVAGQKAYDEFINGENITECNMSYSDYFGFIENNQAVDLQLPRYYIDVKYI